MSEFKFEKPLFLLERVVYPKNLYSALKNYDPKAQLDIFLKNDYVSCIVLYDMNLQRLEEVCEIIRASYVKSFEATMLFIDGDEFTLKVNDWKEQLESGIKEDVFVNTFMKWVFQTSQLKVPLKDDKFHPDYLPKSMCVMGKYSNGLNIGYILFASKGSLLEQPTIGEILKNIDKICNEKIGKSNKTKISKRRPIESRLRHEVFKRDNYSCKECGATQKESTLHCDHILPVAQGGTDEMDNLQTLCAECNITKSDKMYIGGLKKEVKDGTKDN